MGGDVEEPVLRCSGEIEQVHPLNNEKTLYFTLLHIFLKALYAPFYLRSGNFK